MYLKSINMQGFKSFADKIDLEFGQGITAIVGPNGSGKSNISDAIRWVLGEQSVKSLRGSKMEDVIFAGTQKRSQLGFAQVSITLDNSDEIFSIDKDELKVTRRVTRSGESDYYINNTPCRLKDIHELFMDTGLGREGYSVIGQGKIDQILSNKADERRYIFEEASGITKYKYRKHESEKKLLQTEENLVRIKDILVNLEERVEPLRIQSEKARKYLDLREVLKGLDINIAIRNIDKQKENLEEGRKKFKDTYDQLNNEKLRLDLISEQISAKTDQLSEVNEEINKLKEQSFALQKENEAIKGKIEILKNDIKNNSDNALRWQSDAKIIEEKISINQVSIKNNEEEIKAKEEQKVILSKKLEEHEIEIAKFEEKIANQNAQAEKYKAEIVSLLEEISAFKARLSGFDVLIQNFDQRKSALETELKEKTVQKEESTKRLESIEQNIDENVKKKDTALSKMEELKKKYFASRDELEKSKEMQNAKVSELNSVTSKITLLEDLEKGLEGYSKGVKNVLSSNIKGVHGLVSKILTVKDEYVTAIEIALGNMIQNIVVDDEICAKECIKELNRTKGGRATFLPITSIKADPLKHIPEKEKGFVGLACDLVEYDSIYDEIFKNLLGRCVIVDNIDNAVNMAKNNNHKFKIVTLDGQLINAGGSMTGGSFNKNQSLLGRSKEIERLKEKEKSLRKIVDDNDDFIMELKTSINQMADTKAALEEEITSCEHIAVRLEAEQKTVKRIIDELTHSLSVITNENGDILKNISEVENEVKVYNEKIKENEEKIKLSRVNADEFLAMVEEIASERDKFQESILSDRISYNTIDKDIEAAHANIYSLSANKNTLQMELSSKQKDISNIDLINQKLNTEIDNHNKNIQTNIEIINEIANKVIETQKGYEDDTAKLKSIQNSLKEQNETIYLLQQEVARLEAKNSKIEADVEAVISKLWDEYELTYNTALEYKKADFDMNQSQKEAASLRGQIKQLGNINIDAIEEYKEVKEKFDFLTTQKNDLDETKEKLEDIIREMQTVMTEKFVENFNIIQDRFNSVFHELFGGGSGRLTLTDPDNVLESGIEIEVQPPGKKLQNMMALSGGEKALSAIALLFSVLEVRPTPFCILDEVEAALDDNNVYRFADYIRKYSEKTQFIVVTHRRGTMEAADIMYGITMQEKGVSKLLKLKFEDLEDYN